MTEEDQVPPGGSKDVALCSGIKSTAVVKFESVEMPQRFQQLQRDTNLNAVPSNWLHDVSQWNSCVHKASLQRQRTFSRSVHTLPSGDQLPKTDIDKVLAFLYDRHVR